MPRLDFSQRLRVVSLYLDRRLSGTKDKYSILKKTVFKKNHYFVEVFKRLIVLKEKRVFLKNAYINNKKLFFISIKP